MSSVYPVAAEETYQIPSAKAFAELPRHERFLPREALKRNRFRVASADREMGLKLVFASARAGEQQFLLFEALPRGFPFRGRKKNRRSLPRRNISDRKWTTYPQLENDFFPPRELLSVAGVFRTLKWIPIPLHDPYMGTLR